MKNKHRSPIRFCFVVAAAALAVGCTNARSTPDVGTANIQGAMDQAQANIVDTAVEAGSFNTLVVAVEAAGLVDVLKGDGPFTVFAPTDEAFEKLPPGTVDDLLKPENKDKLQAVLTYHVVPGRVDSSQVATMSEAKTVQGSMLKIQTTGGGVMINDANVIEADVACSNGVIHVIDTVVLPAS